LIRIRYLWPSCRNNISPTVCLCIMCVCVLFLARVFHPPPPLPPNVTW
jgi:hypothetical protein